MKDYDPFVYFEDKTIVANKVIMVTGIHQNYSDSNTVYRFSIVVEGLSTPLSYASSKEQIVIDKRIKFLKDLTFSLKNKQDKQGGIMQDDNNIIEQFINAFKHIKNKTTDSKILFLDVPEDLLQELQEEMNNSTKHEVNNEL